MNEAFFAAVRPLFGGSLNQKQVTGIEAVCEEWTQRGDGDNRKLAYLLGTTFHETAREMWPIGERGERAYFNQYEPGTPKGKMLGNTKAGDGYLFRGRGFVQVTGRANYRKFGIEATPDDALKTHVAAVVLIKGCLDGSFTGRKLADYINGTKADWLGARKVVNGTDKAGLIAGYARTFNDALAAGGRPAQPKAPIPATPAPPKPVPPPTTQPAVKRGWLAILIDLILSLFTKGPKP